jgi:hypothetical protein
VTRDVESKRPADVDDFVEAGGSPGQALVSPGDPKSAGRALEESTAERGQPLVAHERDEQRVALPPPGS